MTDKTKKEAKGNLTAAEFVNGLELVQHEVHFCHRFETSERFVEKFWEWYCTFGVRTYCDDEALAEFACQARQLLNDPVGTPALVVARLAEHEAAVGAGEER